MNLEELRPSFPSPNPVCKSILFTQKALYLEETAPSIAYVYIMTPSGGILQGDRYRIDLELSDNARACREKQPFSQVSML